MHVSAVLPTVTGCSGYSLHGTNGNKLLQHTAQLTLTHCRYAVGRAAAMHYNIVGSIQLVCTVRFPFRWHFLHRTLGTHREFNEKSLNVAFMQQTYRAHNSLTVWKNASNKENWFSFNEWFMSFASTAFWVRLLETWLDFHHRSHCSQPLALVQLSDSDCYMQFSCWHTNTHTHTFVHCAMAMHHFRATAAMVRWEPDTMERE